MSKQRKTKRLIGLRWSRGTFGAASPVRIIVKNGEPVEAKAPIKKMKFKRLKPNEYLMLKTERKERDRDVFFNKLAGGTIAARAEKAEKEWRSRLNLDANLHRATRRSAGVNR